MVLVHGNVQTSYRFNSLFDNRLIDYVTNRDFKMSNDCKLQMELLSNGLKTGEKWSLQMYDASSKLQSGLLEGNVIDLGAFEECLAIEDETLRILGKYCLIRHNFVNGTLIQLISEQIGINIFSAFCVPHVCNKGDIKQLLELFGFTVNTTYGIECQTKDDLSSLDTNAIIVLCFVGMVLVIISLSTVYEGVSIYFGENIRFPAFLSFSILSNGTKLTSVAKSPNEISCLAGMRVLNILWIVLGHYFLNHLVIPATNFLKIVDWKERTFGKFASGSLLAVDSFLLISGLLICHTFLYLEDENFNLLKFYFHRVLRLSPCVVTSIAIYTCLVKYISSGPLWVVLMTGIQYCEENWWKNVLFIQNYFDSSQLCLGHFWFLAVDVQLYVLSPLLLFPLKRWPSKVIIASSVLIVVNIVINFLIAWYLQLNTNFPSTTHDDYYKYYYIQTYSRASPWLFGFILGYIIFQTPRTRNKIPFHWITYGILWVISLVAIGLCLTYLNKNVDVEGINVLANSLRNAVLRPTFSLALCWIIYSCHVEQKGIVNKFLSMPFFKIQSRLTYCIYLIHYPIIDIVTLSVKVVQNLTALELFIKLCGIIVLTEAVALLFSLSIESPVLAIEKMLFKKKERKNSVEEASSEVGSHGKILKTDA